MSKEVTMRSFNTLLVVSMLVVMPGRLIGQQSPLPQNMLATFSGSWAEDLWLPTPLPTDIVNAQIKYENSDTTKRVTIDWFYEATGAKPGVSTQSFDIAFRPTAIARRAGKTTRFYLVGWSDRTGNVIVESWTFGQFLLGSGMPQGGGTAYSTFSPPPITRVVEWISERNTLPPIWDAACQTYGNTLLLLANSTPTVIWSLDLATLSVSELFSASTTPGLAGHRMLVIAKHGADGLVAVSEPRRVWDSPTFPPGNELYVVMKDVNLDGTFDVVYEEFASIFYEQYPSPWNNKYVEP
jgi:hypothetical protein